VQPGQLRLQRRVGGEVVADHHPEHGHRQRHAGQRPGHRPGETGPAPPAAAPRGDPEADGDRDEGGRDLVPGEGEVGALGDAVTRRPPALAADQRPAVLRVAAPRPLGPARQGRRERVGEAGAGADARDETAQRVLVRLEREPGGETDQQPVDDGEAADPGRRQDGERGDRRELERLLAERGDGRHGALRRDRELQLPGTVELEPADHRRPRHRQREHPGHQPPRDGLGAGDQEPRDEQQVAGDEDGGRPPVRRVRREHQDRERHRGPLCE
jgi:hypothetical protein